MGWIVWIVAGAVSAAVIAIVINLVASGGAWWLWPVLFVLLAAAVVVEIMRDRRHVGPPDVSQRMTAGGGATVEDSAQLPEGLGTARSPTVKVRRQGKGRKCPQTYRRRR